jgi:hypothetical protein
VSRLDKAECLEMVKDALVQEGFRDTILQVTKPGQVFGLVRRWDGIWQMHVRGFDDGELESEIEIAADYLEHLDDTFRRDATAELKEILAAYQMPCKIEGDITHSKISLPYPEQLTPWKPIVWKPIVMISAIGGLLYALTSQKKKNERG